MPDPVERWIIDLQPVGRRVEIPSGATLLEAAQKAGAGLLAICGGGGKCLECRVRVMNGRVSPLTETEKKAFSQDELLRGYRLACQTVPLSDVKVNIPDESLSAPQRLQVENQSIRLALHPAVRTIDLSLQPPSQSNLKSDEQCLADAAKNAGLPPLKMGLAVLHEFSNQVRRYGWRIRLALRGAECIGLLPEKTDAFGLAVDLGTTKIALYLINLADGKLVSSLGVSNPQIAYGEDVVARIDYADLAAANRETLQREVVDILNQSLAQMCSEAGILPDQVVDAVVVGNTAMHHLIAGIPVHYLAVAPHSASVLRSLTFPACEIGLKIAPSGYVYMPPNIAGFVGGDHVAMLLASGAASAKEATLALDIGTNTEISLHANGHLVSCSCASGPAFEGARISAGMRAAPGAIERAYLVDGQIKWATIGDEPPAGICGSGILDLIGILRQMKVIDARGALQIGQPGVETQDGMRFYRLISASETKFGHEIRITRRDVNEIQLAKAAIRAGVDALLNAAGISVNEIQQVIVAGAFGTYLNIQNAIAIGLLPDLPLKRFHQVGNAAGAGACWLLTDSNARDEAEKIAGQAEYVELTTLPDFSDQFINAISL
jgi:uncharacterized 2Fe-2S/4Fe-4S cluster protein (DUF4445 family)